MTEFIPLSTWVAASWVSPGRDQPRPFCLNGLSEMLNAFSSTAPEIMELSGKYGEYGRFQNREEFLRALEASLAAAEFRGAENPTEKDFEPSGPDFGM
jgi:hypothetical protein